MSRLLWKLQSISMGDVLFCAKQTEAITSNNARSLILLIWATDLHISLSLPCGEQKRQNAKVNYWKTIADKLSNSGWSYGYVSFLDSHGRMLWNVDAHRDDGKRFVVRSEELLTAFLEHERITHELALSVLLGNDSN
jgi:hypothetical protein